jgi:DNA-binding transcriptional ArsR family regulator
MKEKKRISKDESIKQILQLLRKGYATAELVVEMCGKFELSETSVYNHLRVARETYTNELIEQQNKIAEVREQEVVKVAKKGLKSKLERDLEIQNEIEYYQSILNGEVKVSFILGQKVSQTENLPINVVLLVQNTVNELRKELAKRLGEYEAIKTQLDGTYQINVNFNDYTK